MKLNIGSGNRKLNGYINLDKSKNANPDVICDLELGKLPYDDESISEIVATHILEHVQNIIPLMNECYRVLKKDGCMRIIVPQNEGTWADPTHVRAFSKLSFRYYCNYGFEDIYGITCKFKQIKCKFEDNQDGGVLDVILKK